MDGVDVYYRERRVLFDVSITACRGECVTVVGPNGSGKTTILKAAMGVVAPAAGRVEVSGTDVTGRAPHEVAREGVAFVPGDRQLFGRMTVRENLRLGWIAGGRSTPFEERYGAAMEWFPTLDGLGGKKAGTLSGGQQQMLAIARALMAGPEVLLLDEPTEGLAPSLVDGLVSRLEAINDAGRTLLVVDHDVERMRDLGDRTLVVDRGRVFDFEARDGVFETSPVAGGRPPERDQSGTAPARD